MHNAEEYRLQAANARRLTGHISDGELIVTLLKYAAECDEAAAEADLITGAIGRQV